MKTIINIYREIEVPKEYEHLFKKGFRPNWQVLDWDSYCNFTEEIAKTLNTSDEWTFIEE